MEKPVIKDEHATLLTGEQPGGYECKITPILPDRKKKLLSPVCLTGGSIPG